MCNQTPNCQRTLLGQLTRGTFRPAAATPPRPCPAPRRQVGGCHRDSPVASPVAKLGEFSWRIQLAAPANKMQTSAAWAKFVSLAARKVSPARELACWALSPPPPPLPLGAPHFGRLQRRATCNYLAQFNWIADHCNGQPPPVDESILNRISLAVEFALCFARVQKVLARARNGRRRSADTPSKWAHRQHSQGSH